MKANRPRGRTSHSLIRRTDRAVAAAVVMAVTIVLLLVGFSGTSVHFSLPGPAGWLYIGAVIVLATFALAWLFGIGGKPKGQT